MTLSVTQIGDECTTSCTADCSRMPTSLLNLNPSIITLHNFELAHQPFSSKLHLRKWKHNTHSKVDNNYWEFIVINWTLFRCSWEDTISTKCVLNKQSKMKVRLHNMQHYSLSTDKLNLFIINTGNIFCRTPLKMLGKNNIQFIEEIIPDINNNNNNNNILYQAKQKQIPRRHSKIITYTMTTKGNIIM